MKAASMIIRNMEKELNFTVMVTNMKGIGFAIKDRVMVN
jgi:hypothetical protein